MRIGIDASCWVNGRGYGRYTRELIRAMVAEEAGHEFVLFADAGSAARIDLEHVSVAVRGVELSVAPTEAASADGARSPFDMWRMRRAVKRESLDVFFFPTVYTYFPLAKGPACVVGIHDAIAERFPELTLPSRRARLFWALKVKQAVKRATLVLTVSEFARGELEAVIGIAAERIRVAVEAPSADYAPVEVGDAATSRGVAAGADWFVYVGGFNPHKLVDTIVRAHATVAAGRENPPHLLLVGTLDGDVFHGARKTIRDAIEICGTDSLVHWTGFVADDDLRRLHSGAAALVMPSANEGFGLPAIEAAACGAPVIATTESPLPQLLEGAGIFVRPGDETALAEAMATLLDDVEERRAMGRRGCERTGELSWSRTARETLAVLTEAAA